MKILRRILLVFILLLILLLSSHPLQNVRIMLEKEFQYYLDHQNELVQKYNGKFLLIKNQQVVGAFDTNVEAYNAGKSQFEPGTFLIQRCSQGNSDYTQTFHSRVSFV